MPKTATLLLAALLAAGYAGAQTVYPPVVKLTAEQDHQRTLDLLGIKTLRPGRNGSDPGAANYANYDESKAAASYAALPDPLVLENGKKVTTAAMWWHERRPQLVEIFNREIYGRMPAHTPAVAWELKDTKRSEEDGVPVIVKTLVGHVDNSAYPLVTVNMELTLTTPARANGPVPVMMEFGYVFPKRAGFTPPPPAPGPTWQQQVLAKGWGYAVLIPVTIQPNNGGGLTEGIIGLCNHGQPRKLDDWGALRAWGWGASRAMDYFETDQAVDAKHVGMEGHSRYGKAALVTMADDSRFAIAYISSSGEGGAKVLRRDWGEVLENVAGTSEYHWMAGNFLKYAGPLRATDLPVDANELIALAAPRPLFLGAGATEGDGWADARGTYLAAVAAGPVYRLLGRQGILPVGYPAIETAAIAGDIGFRQHRGGHTPAPNWPVFLEFASRYMQP